MSTAISCGCRRAAGCSSTRGSAPATSEAQWRPVLDELDAPIEQIFVTHMHPDHVGGARDVAELTGAPVMQGREDFQQCVAVWGPDRDSARFAQHWRDNGVPASDLERSGRRDHVSRRRGALRAGSRAARGRRHGRRLGGGGAPWACRRAPRPVPRRRADRRRLDLDAHLARRRRSTRTRVPIRWATIS